MRTFFVVVLFLLIPNLVFSQQTNWTPAGECAFNYLQKYAIEHPESNMPLYNQNDIYKLAAMLGAATTQNQRQVCLLVIQTSIGMNKAFQ